jgi:hypothetical protein
LIDNDIKKRLISNITKIISHHVNDEGELGDIYDLVCRHIGLVNKAEKSSVQKLNAEKESERKLIAVDFDGVIHEWVEGSYKGDATDLCNPPVNGAISWLSSMVNDGRFFITIYSSRSKILGFEDALRKWLADWGMDQEVINKISISVTKPFAFVYIDDRQPFTGLLQQFSFSTIPGVPHHSPWHTT